MKFVSTSNPLLETSLAEAVSGCIAPDGGLLLPASLPKLPGAFFNNIAELSLKEIAYVIATSFFGDDIPPHILKDITDRAFGCGIPLVAPGGGDAPRVLELFHGPTLTVKDFGAMFMAGIILRLNPTADQENDGWKVLLASSGNSAVAIGSAFRSIRGADFYVVCPHGSVRRRRHSILSSFGSNVHIIEAGGDIDQCNGIVRTCIADERAAGSTKVCGANSVNIARLIPAVVFFFHAYSRLRSELGQPEADRAVYSVPCGNLTALTAAVIARRMGLPMGKIVAAQTVTDALGAFLRNDASPSGSHSRLATSMNADCPTSLPRLVSLCGGRDGIAREIDTVVVSDSEIEQTMRGTLGKHRYSLSPHSAVAFAAAGKFTGTGVPVVALATAHPAVDIDVFTAVTGAPVELPHQLTRLMNTKLLPVIRMAPTVPALRKLVRGALHPSKKL